MLVSLRKLILFTCITLQVTFLNAQPKSIYNLRFDTLNKRWDEAMPLGNGWLGALIWQKENKLRLSIDRVDLWDDRPMPEIDQLKFKWVVEQVKKGQYDTVQKLGDEPYEKYAAPTKIPGAAIEFDLDKLGKVISNELDISNGLSTIKFDNGVVFYNYIHADKQTGYFGIEHMHQKIEPELIIPPYHSGKNSNNGNSVEGQGLERLGYQRGTVTKKANSVYYHQPTYNGSYYEVLIQWYWVSADHVIGMWTISNNKPAVLEKPDLKSKEPTHWDTHTKWWKDYWNRSSIAIPDSILERQYYLEMYKFACVARSNTPPISLQAIWTADNGNLPPWKGDLHHDLNTQLSYWPGYNSNHLDLTAGYTNWLWKVKEENKKWTKAYFETDGLNVPGVTTISGKAMGGWIQYSMSPTTAAWLSQYFYWQWRYSMDKKILVERSYPYIKDVELFLLSMMNKTPTKSNLPLSSSPEYHDNSIKAWFTDYTNYDLSLVKALYNFSKRVSLAAYGQVDGLGRQHYLQDFDKNETGLTVAHGQNLEASHRHLSPYMAIYPLKLLDVDKTDDRVTIDKSLRWIEKKGTSNWCGYSFSWMGCMYAAAKEADSAASMLKKFATNFCSINSFHLNGDQKGGQYSSFTYRPFTLEGNFAFAQGIHEMLVRDNEDHFEVFPAIPVSWKDVSFQNLRIKGAFLVSAKKENGIVKEISIHSIKGGELNCQFPFDTWAVAGCKKEAVKINKQLATIIMKPGQTIVFSNLSGK